MAEDSKESRLSSEQVVADLLRLGELLALHSRPIGALGLGRRIRSEESIQLKAEIAELEKRIEIQAYDKSRRALRSVLGLQKDEVLDQILLRCIAVVAFEALDNFRSVSTVAGVSKAVGLGDWSSTLDARHAIRQAIIKGHTISYSEEGCEGGVLKAGRNLIRFMSGEYRLGVLWTEESIKREKEDWNRRNGDALKRTSTSSQPAPLPSVQKPIESQNLLTARGIFNALRDEVIAIDAPLLRFCGQMSLHMRRLEQIRKGIRPSVGPIISLIIGNSGTGKTWMAECFARVSGLPFTIADMSCVSQTSYVGLGLDECFLGLLANKTKSQDAQMGILVMDEFDKICAKGSGGHSSVDAQGLGIQSEILKPWDGCLLPLGSRRSNIPSFVVLDTFQTCFVACGAFQGLRELLAEGNRKSTGLGFCSAEAKNPRNDIRDALVRYGFMAQIVNRIGSIIVLPDLIPEQIVRIITHPNGLLAKQNAFLGSFGMKLDLSEDGVKYLANWACETKGYSRAVKSILGSLVERHLYDDKAGDINVWLADMKKAISETEGAEGLQI